VNLPTPLECERYRRYSSSAEVAAYLTRLQAAAPDRAQLRHIGRSALGMPLHALICTAATTTPKLKVMIVGSQHGASEAAGCEAILLLAREVLVGEQRELLDDLDLIFIPNANPDGRDADSSKNGNAVNINRDYVLLTQPESCALDAAVIDFAPDIILDAHESASLKRRTLGQQGYLTDFEAQFDIANTPAIPAVSRDYLARRLLPDLIAGVMRGGLRAQRYIREITSIMQPLTHGGFTIKRFRNKAGIRGSLTVLLETPMEPKAGQYPTFRNIGVRVEKQQLCMRVFLNTVREHTLEIRDTQALARQESPTEISLNGRYVPNTHSPEAVLGLRRRDTGERIEVTFPDHRMMVTEDIVVFPRYYYITAHAQLFAALLARHRVDFEVLGRAARHTLRGQVFCSGDTANDAEMRSEPWAGKVDLGAGGLRVPLQQRNARIIPLLLDPRAASSVFQYGPFGRLIDKGSPLFIYTSNE
jgi:Zinc carboxypeptidase